MTSRDFCHWLMGYFEVAKPIRIGDKATEMIKKHLALVFIHEIDPSVPDPTGTLQDIHDGVSDEVKKAFENLKMPRPEIPAEQIVYRC